MATFLNRWIFLIGGVVFERVCVQPTEQAGLQGCTSLSSWTVRPRKKCYYLQTTLIKYVFMYGTKHVCSALPRAVHVHDTTKRSKSACLRLIYQVLAGGWRGRVGSALGWASGARLHAVLYCQSSVESRAVILEYAVFS